MLYSDVFGVPAVYVNSLGKLEYIPCMEGYMMRKHGFRMDGMTKIYDHGATPVDAGIPGGSDVTSL